MTENEDIRDLLFTAGTPPQEAAENISFARQADIDPDSFVDLKKDLKPELEKTTYPNGAPRPFVDRMVQSTQHASVMKDDIQGMNSFSRYLKFSVDTLKGKDISADIAMLSYKEATGQELTEDEEFQLLNLNEEIKSVANRDDYGYNMAEIIPAEVIGTGYDMLKRINRNRKYVVQGATTGLVLGGASSVALGPAAPLGPVAGAIGGAGLGLGAAQIMGTYYESTGHVNNDLRLLTDDDGAPVLINAEERRALAHGAGALMAAVELVPVGKLASTVPWVKHLTNSRTLTKFLTTVEAQPIRQILLNMGRQAMAEGGAEAAQETIQAIATELGQGWDGNQIDFIEGLSRAYHKKGEIASRAGEAFVLGAAVGGVLSGAGNVAGNTMSRMAGTPPSDPGAPQSTVESGPQEPIPTAPSPIATDASGENVAPSAPDYIRAEEPVMQDIQPPADSDMVGEPGKQSMMTRGTRAVQFKVMMDVAVNSTKDMQTNQLLPDEMDQIRQKMFDDAGTSNVYVDKEDLRAWADDDEKAKAIRDLIDPSGETAAQIDAPIQMEVHKFLKLAQQYPEITDIVKEEPTSLTASRYMEMWDEAEAKRQAITSQVPDRTPEQVVTPERVKDEDIINEQDYLNQETFTRELETILPTKEIEKINVAQQKARVEIANAIREDVEYDMHTAIDLENQIIESRQRDEEIARIESDENINMVEDFINNNRVIGPFSEMDINQQTRLHNNRPVYAINPESMVPYLRSKFIDDEVLKRRKTFDKNGMDINDVAKIFGTTPSGLLRVLSETPTKKQAIKNMEARRKAAMDEERLGRQLGDLDETRVAKAYDNMAKIHMRELKTILNKSYGSFQAMVKRVALTMPNVSEIASRAKDQIGSTRVRDLNVNQWKVGERRSRARAVQAALRNRVELTYREFTNAVTNNRLGKETHLAVTKVNRAIKWLARTNDQDFQLMLKRAGKTYEMAFKDLLALYNFDKSQRDQDNVDGYRKFAQRMLAEGRGNFVIPDEVSSWITPKQSYKDMTVDQFLEVVGFMQTVATQARLKNKLLDKNETRTIEMIADEAALQGRLNPHFDPNKAVEIQGEPTLESFVDDKLSKTETLTISNINFLTQELDLGNKDSFWRKMIYDPLMGTGTHSNTPYGQNAKIKLLGQVRKKLKGLIADYDKNRGNGPKYRDLGITRVYIKEFANIKSLGNGHLRKLDLLEMAKHVGNDENIDRLENFGVPKDVIMNVLIRELGPNGFDFVQGVWNTIDSFKERIAANERMKGNKDVNFTVPRSFNVGGKTYRGGHYKLSYRWGSSAASLIADMDNHMRDMAEKGEYVPSAAFEGIVRSPHTKQRTGSAWEVDLNAENMDIMFEDMIHDLAFAVPTRDVMTLLKNEKIANTIASIMGLTKADNLMNHVAKLTNSAMSANTQVFVKQNNHIRDIISYVDGVFGMSVIAFNPKSWFMSTLAIPQYLTRVGPKGMRYLGRAIATMSANPMSWKEFHQFAAEIDNSVQARRSDVSEFGVRFLADITPQKRIFTNKPYNTFRNFQAASFHAAFDGILGTIDQLTKTWFSLAAYSQYLAGDVEGVSLEKLSKMTPQERVANAKGWASQILNSTTIAGQQLDRSAIQSQAPAMARFYNEVRNSLANTVYVGRKVKGHYKNGEYKDAGRELANWYVGKIFSAMFAALAAGTLTNLLADEEDDRESATFAQAMDNLPTWFLEKFFNPIEMGKVAGKGVASEVVLLRDMLNAAEYNQPVTIPFFSTLTDINRAVTTSVPAYYYNITDGMGFMEAFMELKRKDQKALLMSISAGVKGIPVSATLKLLDFIKSNGGEISDDTIQNFMDESSEYIEKYDQDPDGDSDGKTSQLQKSVDDVKSLRAQTERVVPPEVALTESEFDIIREAESNNNWMARSPAGAAGVYQFTESTWNLIRNHPEGRKLGLTEDGRTSRDQTEQQIAMEFLVNDNAKSLKRQKVPVNLESIYFAHHFGVEHAQDVFNVPDNRRLPTELLNSKVLKYNPQLKGIKTAGDMKRYLDRTLDRGRDNIAARDNLTTDDMS